MKVECKICGEIFDNLNLDEHFKLKHPDIFCLYKNSDEYKRKHRWDCIKNIKFKLKFLR